jgi:hypothetical protein
VGTEREPGSRARTAASVGALAALTLAGGYALSGVPNVEVMTLIAFAGGWLTGVAGGAAVGVLGMTLFTSANPYGAAVPLVAAAQVISMGFVGACGGLWGRSSGRRPRSPSAIEMAALGAGLTAVYDLTTNASIGIAFSQLTPTLVAGIPFALIHIISNALLFGIAGPYLIKGLVAAGLCPAGRIYA